MPLTIRDLSIAALASVALGTAADAQERNPGAAPDWQVQAGAGVAFKPEYPGSKDYEASPLPRIDITWKDRVFLNETKGLGVYAVKRPEYSLGLSVGYHGGRDDDDHLRGMGEIDATAQARLFGQFRAGPLSLGATFGRDLGADEGATLDLSAAIPFDLGNRWTIRPGIQAMLADDDYMESWFGVTAAQSAASGLGQYHPRGGLVSAGVFVSATYQLTPRWSLGTSLKMDKLLGDAADSPVVERKFQPALAVSAAYRF
jgi:Outer membrane protein V